MIYFKKQAFLRFSEIFYVLKKKKKSAIVYLYSDKDSNLNDNDT